MIIIDLLRAVAEVVGWLVLIVSVMILFELHPVGWTIGFAATGACMLVLGFEILRHLFSVGTKKRRAATATVKAASEPLPNERSAPPPKRPQIDPFKQGR